MIITKNQIFISPCLQVTLQRAQDPPRVTHVLLAHQQTTKLELPNALRAQQDTLLGIQAP